MRRTIQGEIRRHPNSPSDPIGRCVAYLPPSFGPTPVLYLLHGVGDDENSWETRGAASRVVEELAAEGKTDHIVIAMPFGFLSEKQKVDRRCPDKHNFNRHLDTLIRAFEACYGQVDENRRAIAGLSMGGKQALEYTLDHLDSLEAIGAFSPAL